MRIGIDYTPAALQGAGIGRYTRGLVDAVLPMLDARDQVTLLFPRDEARFARSAWPANVRTRRLPLPDRYQTILWQRLRLPFYVELMTGALDIFHAPNFLLPPVRSARKLLTIMSQRLRRANSKMESLAYMDMAGRLARYFLDLARDHGQSLGNGWIVIRRPTHSDIAHSIGTSRETVSRVINDFESQFGMVNKGRFTYIRESQLQ